MIILITGASHTGKTALAQKLLEKYKYPYLSIDHLKMGLIRSGNTKLTPMSDDRDLTEYLWPIVREIIKTAVENKQNFTGEAFITDEGREKINDEFAPLAVDMETASIAHVCYVNKIPFLSIRCITDTAEHSGVENFEENCAKASEIAKDITAAFIKEYSRRQDI